MGLIRPSLIHVSTRSVNFSTSRTDDGRPGKIGSSVKQVVYFDSNIYQDLVELGGLGGRIGAALATAVEKRRISVFLTFANATELEACHAVKPERARSAFLIIRRLCEPRSSRSLRDLLQREVRRLKDPSIKLSLPENSKSSQHAAFVTYLQESSAGRIDARLARQEQEEVHSEFVSLQNTGLNAARLELRVVGKPPPGRIPNFGFWSGSDEREAALKPTLAQWITANRLDSDVETLWSRLGECPALALKFAYAEQLFLHNLVRGRRPRRSDAYDLRHAGYAAYADRFVTNDAFFRDSLTAADPSSTRVQSLAEFVESL